MVIIHPPGKSLKASEKIQFKNPMNDPFVYRRQLRWLNHPRILKKIKNILQRKKSKRETENPTKTHTPSKGADFETRNIDLFEGSLIRFWSTDVQNQNYFSVEQVSHLKKIRMKIIYMQVPLKETAKKIPEKNGSLEDLLPVLEGGPPYWGVCSLD